MKKILIGLAVGFAVGIVAYRKSSEIKSLVEKGKKKLNNIKE